MKKETFGQRLQRLRTRANISQDQLAEALKTTRQTISNWENDRCAVDYFSLLDIQKLLCVSWDELMDDGFTERMKHRLELENMKSDKERYFEDNKEHFRYPFTNIAGLEKAGDYRISVDDFTIAFHRPFGVADCIAIAKEAHEIGFTILDVDTRGFRIRFEDDTKVKEFKEYLGDLMAYKYEHEPRFRLGYQKYDVLYDEAMLSIENDAVREIFDIDSGEIYEIVDRYGEIYGYAGSKEEAEKLAKKLELKEYKILPKIRQ